MTINRTLPSTTRSLPISLLRAREKVMGPIRHMLADAGVTEQQWRVLRVLTEQGPLDPTSIADQACLLLPSLTRILQKLEEKGMVTRARDQVDRRRQVIEATEQGKALIHANAPTSQGVTDHLRDRFGQERYEALLDLLNDLNDLDV